MFNDVEREQVDGKRSGLDGKKGQTLRSPFAEPRSLYKAECFYGNTEIALKHEFIKSNSC